MKKLLATSLLLLTVGALTACSNTNNSSSSEAIPVTSVESSSIESSSIEEASAAVFTATVKEVTELNTQENAIQVLLENPENVENAEDMLSSFNDGVALNLDPTTLDFDQSEFEVGTKVKVTLKENAPMTMSIPPQIPGNSIILVELVK